MQDALVLTVALLTMTPPYCGATHYESTYSLCLRGEDVYIEREVLMRFEDELHERRPRQLEQRHDRQHLEG